MKVQMVENNYQDDPVHNDSIIVAGGQKDSSQKNYGFGGPPGQSHQKQESSASQGSGGFRTFAQRKQTKQI